VQYIHMTLHSMRHFGVDVVPEAGVQNVFHVPQGQYAWRGEGNVVVEADASSATYFGAIAALTGRTVTLLGVGTSSTQGKQRLPSLPAPSPLAPHPPPPGSCLGPRLYCKWCGLAPCFTGKQNPLFSVRDD
jgi:hypothetical protein